jgi:tetratricopeptide (TPR) repeat protein
MDRHKEAMVILEVAGRSERSTVALSTLAEIYKKEKRLVEALQTLQMALAASVRGRAHAMLLSNIGSLQWDLGHRELSVKTQQAAVEEAENVFGKDHPDTALILEEFGWLLRKVGRKSEAAQVAERAANIRSKYAAQTNEGGFSVDWLELAAKRRSH